MDDKDLKQKIIAEFQETRATFNREFKDKVEAFAQATATQTNRKGSKLSDAWFKTFNESPAMRGTDREASPIGTCHSDANFVLYLIGLKKALGTDQEEIAELMDLAMYMAAHNISNNTFNPNREEIEKAIDDTLQDFGLTHPEPMAA